MNGTSLSNMPGTPRTYGMRGVTPWESWKVALELRRRLSRIVNNKHICQLGLVIFRNQDCMS